MNDMIELLNKIRNDASSMYKERVPEASQTNLDEIRFAMTDGPDKVQVANEFMSAILNKIALTKIHNKLFENPLAPLKQGFKPLGDTIEEIYSNFIKQDQDAFNGDNLLKRKLPDTKVVYHRKNYESQYTVTVNRTKLKYAFSSFENLASYISTTINAAYNSLHLDEFVNMKEIFARAYEHNAIKVIPVPNPLKSKENAEAFIEVVKTVSGWMKYPSSKYNSYLDAQNVDKEPVITFSNYNEQVLILPEDVNVKVDVSVLANTFNMPLAEFNKTRKMLIDAFPVKNAVGALFDEQFLQVHDDNQDVTEFFNAKARYTNYYINNEQTISFSPLVNAVIFVVAEDTEDSNTTVDEFTITKSVVEGASITNTRKSVVEGNSYTATVKGEFTSVQVSMGGTDITSAVYDTETNKIAIDSVTGDIVITVA